MIKTVLLKLPTENLTHRAIYLWVYFYALFSFFLFIPYVFNFRKIRNYYFFFT